MTGATPGTLPEPEVQAMFDRIARVYDRLNSVMTAGLHHAWRRRAAELAGLSPGDRALDVATGTGDLALELGHRVAPDGTVIAVDFSEQMLKLAREKLVSRGLRTSSPVDVANSSTRTPGRPSGVCFAVRSQSMPASAPQPITEVAKPVIVVAA